MLVKTDEIKWSLSTETIAAWKEKNIDKTTYNFQHAILLLGTEGTNIVYLDPAKKTGEPDKTPITDFINGFHYIELGLNATKKIWGGSQKCVR